MHNHTKSHTSLTICSLNVNRSNAVTHAAMNAIAESKNPKFDIFLVQEPWWEKIHTTHGMVSFMALQLTLPNSPMAQTPSPQVTPYHTHHTHSTTTLPN